MSWAKNVIWWHCYPLRFVDAPLQATDETGVHHRLPQLTNWLDYVIELGANGLLLAPVFASLSHGYDTLDHFTVDPRLGDEADVVALIDAAHSRGIQVAFDGVFNHLARDHELVRRALTAGAGTSDGDWIKWSNGYPYLFEGHPDLVELNLSHPPVADYVVSVMRYWTARGVDAWRLDAAYAAGATPWHEIVSRVREEHRDIWIFGEVLHGDYAGFVSASGVDSVTQYELWKAIWSSLNDVNFHELAWALQRHQDFCAAFSPMTFIGNHDTTRIATKLTNPKLLPLAEALLFLLPGVPTIYAGDEQGFTGEKLDMPSGDDAVRPPFPKTPAGLMPFGAPVLERYRHLISLRRRNSWLVDATVSVPQVTNDKATLVMSGREGQRLTLSLDATAATWQIS